METLLWLLAFPALLVGAWLIVTNMGKRALSRHLSRQEEVEPWDNWKQLAAESRKRKEADKAEWQAEFQAILRRTCRHDFDDASLSRKKWWQCGLCGWEKPWQYEAGCSCVTTTEKALTDAKYRTVLYHRDGNCPVHGRPRLIAYHKKNELERRENGTGGYLGLHKYDFER